MPLENVRIVLVRPIEAGNVGAVARIMKNMGLRELVLVEPAPLFSPRARFRAVHARDVLDAARRVRSLGEAVADCRFVVGTTARAGRYRRGARSPRELAPRILSYAAGGPVALVFGPEDRGLTNEDIPYCSELLTIPASPEYSSLNLAHAVAICAYELFLASREGAFRPAETRPVPSELLERMYGELRQALLEIGFLHEENPDHIVLALRQLFGRTTLEEREVRIFLGLARQILWFARGGREVAERKRAAGLRLK
ncbi:MAG: tRNA (cytidine/uridine-2'-O-)-methyltransferase TrmJ [Candidatus Binatia bacterium]|nr:MAG: tRNA (cytidine/uridine-2'-O-)-methyltransferase TrmJ [Candidatus Binatia bacterium]